MQACLGLVAEPPEHCEYLCRARVCGSQSMLAGSLHQGKRLSGGLEIGKWAERNPQVHCRISRGASGSTTGNSESKVSDTAGIRPYGCLAEFPRSGRAKDGVAILVALSSAGPCREIDGSVASLASTEVRQIAAIPLWHVLSLARAWQAGNAHVVWYNETERQTDCLYSAILVASGAGRGRRRMTTMNCDTHDHSLLIHPRIG
ncbi:hypothetical protein CCUS01_10120 [Colletotrichum cuscutae]|uniref:Uncharacterized protein n=1 Tax=Colletotrichum cuscutae TaxID=1209917 RepID=A0AAI9UDH0_9PEZI|nr:hypothetical protein CCUS01_10120 [Colletotrichum cuscutae]